MIEEQPLRPPKNLDDIPVGTSNNNINFSEYPEDYDPNQVQQAPVEIPLDVRMRSKILKQRQSAFQDILKGLQSDDIPAIEIKSQDLVNFIQEPILVAQEKGVQVALKWIEKHPRESFDFKEISKAVIEKVLVQAKPNLKKAGYDILIMLFEMGHYQSMADVIANSCLQQKNPKIVCASMQTILELLNQFGLKKLDSLKPYWSKIEEHTQSQQTAIKNEAMNFYKEASKWMGKNIEAKIFKLKPEQKDEIVKFYQSLPEDTCMKPIRGDSEAEMISLKDQKDVDLYDQFEAVDVLAKQNFKLSVRFPDAWCEKVMAIEKWLEKKEVLECLLQAVGITRIAPNLQNTNPIVQMLKKFINYNHIAIQLVAIKICGLMASGLRKNFTHYGKVLLTPMMQKLKDKKQQIIDEVFIAIKKFFYVLNLDDIMPDVQELLKDKAPNARANALQVVEFYIDSQPKQVLARMVSIKQLPNELRNFIDDGSQEVREKSITILAKIQGLVYDGQQAKMDFSKWTKDKQDKLTKINQIAQGYVKKVEENNISIEIEQKQTQQNKPPQQKAVVQQAKRNSTGQQQQQQQTVQPTHFQQPQQQIHQQQTTSQLAPPRQQQQNQSKQLQQSMSLPNITPLQELKKQEEVMANSKPLTVFQSKEQRITLEIQNPFPITEVTEKFVETLKQMFQLPGFPQQVINELFSLNPNSTLRALRVIRLQMAKVADVSDILFKACLVVGWFKDNLPLQQSILTFILHVIMSMKKENVTIHQTEVRTIRGYLQMILYMLCKNCSGSSHLLGPRLLPTIMLIYQQYFPIMQEIYMTKETIMLDDEDDVGKAEYLRITKQVIELSYNKLKDYSTDIVKNRQIINDLCAVIQQQKQIIVEDLNQKPSHQQFQQQQQQQPERNDQQQQIMIQMKLFQTKVRQLTLNDQTIRQYHSNVIDLALTIGNVVFQMRDVSLVTDFSVELGNLMTCAHLAIPYQKFFDMMNWLFKQILAEVNCRDEEHQTLLKIINGAMIKILNQSDVTNLYLSLMDIITKERANNTNQQLLQQQISLITRCLNKIVPNIKTKLISTNLSMILDRFTGYLSRFCQFPDGQPPDSSRRGDDVLAKAMKTAVLLFVKMNSFQELMHILQQQGLGVESHLYRWVLETQEDDVQVQVGARRYSLLRQERLQPTDINLNLEKKVVELENLQQTMNQ